MTDDWLVALNYNASAKYFWSVQVQYISLNNFHRLRLTRGALNPRTLANSTFADRSAAADMVAPNVENDTPAHISRAKNFKCFI